MVRFAVLVLILGLAIYLLHRVGPFAPFRKAAFIALAGFSIFSFQLCLASAMAADAKNPNFFTQLIMASSFVKMLLTIGLLSISNRLLPPGYAYFFVTYLFLYIAFTVFEVSFLMRIARKIGHGANARP